MSDQMTFVEPLKRAKFKRTSLSKLSDKFGKLGDWYTANRPSVKLLRISKDDARSIREAWVANEIEARQNGFHCVKLTPNQVTQMSYRGFDLVES